MTENFTYYFILFCQYCGYQQQQNSVIISLLQQMQRMQRQSEPQRQDSLPNKSKKDPKTKPIKKKNPNFREITHYFNKIQKQVPLNKNIPTPDKTALEQMDRNLSKLHEQQQELQHMIEQTKLRLQVQKESREQFLNRSRCMITGQLKKIEEINRFFKRQNNIKLTAKEHALKNMEQGLIEKRNILKDKMFGRFQRYFLQKQIMKQDKEAERLRLQVSVQIQSSRVASQEQNCCLAKEGWPLLIRRYQPLQLIGKGGFSQVYKAYDQFTNTIVAIKLSSVDHLLQGCGNRNEYLKHIKRQYQIHKELDHPNIVRLIEVFEVDSAICIVLEYCEGRTLAQYLRLQGMIEENQAKMIAQNLARVIAYLSSKQPAIIHYDLKPQNIIFSSGQLKVLDFGICKTIDSEHSRMALTSQGVGTYWYLPPQTFASHNPVVSNKVDVWSLGVILYQMLFSKRPILPRTSQSLQINTEQLFNGTKPISDNCRRFIEACLQPDQSRRIDPSQLLKHPFFSSYPISTK